VALIVGGEGLNPLNGVTLLAGVVGGATAMIWADKPLVLVLAGVAITLASVPALIGGVGLLFIACALAIEVAAVWQRSG
jgi:hypothetical protein